MKIDLNLDSVKEIFWPTQCVFCNHKAEDYAIATSAAGTGIYPGFWTERIRSIKYPVCSKHKVMSRIVNIPGKLGFVRGALLIILSPMVYILPLALVMIAIEKSAGIKILLPDAYVKGFIYGSYLLNIGIYMFAKLNRPFSIQQLAGC